jgi:hypothetical protein
MFGGDNMQHKGHAYDGELNSMTFNLVKSSDAFTKKAPLFDVSVLDQDDEFNRWLNNNQSSTKEKRLTRKSEEGWPKRPPHRARSFF